VQTAVIPPGAEIAQRSRTSVVFDVFPEGRDHLDLVTGEVFQDPSYARIRKTKDNTIGGTVQIYAGYDETDYNYSRMKYVEAHNLDDLGDTLASVNFTCFLPPDDFDALLDTLRSQLLPSAVTIHLKHDLLEKASAIEYGWEPDGSGMQWDNKTAKLISIEAVEVVYNLFGQPEYVTENTTSEVMSVPEAVKAQRKELREVRELVTSFRQDFNRLAGGIIFFGLGAAMLFLFYLQRK
jgi:hypothetical protein